MKDLERYLSQYKKEDEEDFNESFKEIEWNKVSYEFHSVSYIINRLHHTDEAEDYKYISAKVRLEYDDMAFAEYESIYGLDGSDEDDYFRKV